MRIPLVFLAVAVGALLIGFGRGDGSSSRPQIVATTTEAADLARNVAGDRAEVRSLLTPDSDPHEYEPRPGDIDALTGADLVLRSGGDLDEWLDGAIESAGGGAPVLDLLDEVGAERGDPHWWQDPRRAEQAVGTIETALSVADPEGADGYAERARAYEARLRELDAGVARCIDGIPEAQRKLVTTHDALGYYADRYGLEVIGTVIPALTTQAQASAGDLAKLSATIRRERVRAIFAESAVNAKIEKAIARETGARVGEPLWADSLGPEKSSGATYVDSIRANTAAITRGLTGRSCSPR